jgi:hypothetical protein
MDKDASVLDRQCQDYSTRTILHGTVRTLYFTEIASLQRPLELANVHIYSSVIGDILLYSPRLQLQQHQSSTI